jgi:membrane fusion protein (multidrug efflux system)
MRRQSAAGSQTLLETRPMPPHPAPGRPRDPVRRPARGYRSVALLITLLVVAGCGRGPTPKGTAAPPAAPPPEVTVLQLVPRTTPLSTEIVSEIKALQQVDLRPRVSGIVTRIAFKPGQRVKAGDLLFTIDPRAYDEAVTSARANLAEAEANLARVRQDVERYAPLLADNAIPRQTYDQTVAQERQYRAVVDARRAGLESARIERSYAEVRSPLSGTIGLQQIEVGGLASAGQTVLATVSTRDPMAAYFNIPEADYLAFARRVGTASDPQAAQAARPLELVLADGSVYPVPGRFDFADRALNPATGTLTLRALFANPSDLLRPGMNARVRIVYDVLQDAILVPQRAVSEMLGRYFVMVVIDGDRIEQRAITPGARIGEDWLVQSGLKAGERIMVDGLQGVRPGMVVTPRQIAPLPGPGSAGVVPGPAAPAAAAAAPR